MGFGSKREKGKSFSKGGKSKREKSDHEYRKIGAMWKSKKFDGHNMSMDDYFGDLIFRDKESGKFYKVKGASLFDPRGDAPENLIYNMVVDLKSEYHVEEMDEDAGGSEEDEG